MAIIPKPYRNFKLGPPKTGARQRVLAQWRGIDVSPLETARSLVRVRKASDIMPKLLTDLRMDKRRAEAEVLKVWNSLIDPSIVAHAQPTGLNKGTLFVAVDSSPWLDEIVRYRRREILDRLQHSFGRDLIAKISFRIG
jgi:predicted nucleic acid-binding Zn ribbon protein